MPMFFQNILYYLTAHKPSTPNDLCQPGQPKFVIKEDCQAMTTFVCKSDVKFCKI